MIISKTYDVAILGTGIGGTILGAILARHGLKVLLLEGGAHPRFAIGESTIPETTFMFRLLAERYGVPEIGYLSNFQRVRRHVSSTCGIKRSFSFVYHRVGEPQRLEESMQFSNAPPPLGPDVHLFRQDVDAYMLSVAVGHGATVQQHAEVTDVDFDGRGVTIATRHGGAFRARYFVDAGGLRSFLARKLDLREDPCPLRTRSRSLYTHMLGVLPYDACGDTHVDHGLPTPLSQATLHNLFKGGWMWVIPFDNHPSSTNRLVSVGLQLNLDIHPPTGAPPEEEFRRIVATMPKVARQFERARAVREWTSLPRLQFSSRRTAGDRWCMLPHAASFVDPLYSSGLAVTMSTINILASRLIQAASDGDFSAARFAHVETWMRRNFDYFDRLVSGSYNAYRDFNLWNAWIRLWMVGGLYGALGVLARVVHYQGAKDKLLDAPCEGFPYRGIQGHEIPEFAALFEAAQREMDAVVAGELASEEAARRIFQHVEASGLWPEPWGPARPGKRNPGGYNLALLMRTGQWAIDRAPEVVRRHFSRGASMPVILKLVADDWADEVRVSIGNAALHLRDYFVMANGDYDVAARRSLAMDTAPPPAEATSEPAASTAGAGPLSAP
ncbi:NAD(P)/FAD-dependent oxidoreductase [Sorangium sp. So ce1099]|uniref:NAD(P)/FAD-dependent oxidoreductase n=1 Tax=Sorangium sp. So ce1099 TaxID=3133331 RepID=UPI003F626F66